MPYQFYFYMISGLAIILLIISIISVINKDGDIEKKVLTVILTLISAPGIASGVKLTVIGVQIAKNQTVFLENDGYKKIPLFVDMINDPWSIIIGGFAFVAVSIYAYIKLLST